MSGEPSKPTPSAEPQVQRLGKYDIERRLGAGGMGTVYLAKDRELKRTVALKVLPKDRAQNPQLVKRFKAEGQAGAHLQHKNIIAVYESGEIDGYLYLALEYVDGIDLLEWIRKRGVLPVRRSVEIMKQVAEALQHAFEKQVVHRDIKPSNIMIKSDGTVKLADMGLARIVDDTLDTGITRAGTTVGTVDYMSPEQARSSKAADIRSDLYSLGCTWYHMLTGKIPYPEGSLTNKLQAHASAAIPDPRTSNPQIPEGVVAVIQRLMAKRPEDRYQTPAELLKDIGNPHLARGGISANMLAALAGEGAPPPDSADFVLQKGSPTPLSVANSPTRTDVDVFGEGLDSQQELPEETEVSQIDPKLKGKSKGKLQPAGSGGGTVKGRGAGANTEKPVKSRPLPAKSKGVSSEPVGGNSGGWGFALDIQKLGMILAGIIVVVVGITWGVQALPGLFERASPEVQDNNLTLQAENRQLEEPRPQPNPIEMVPENPPVEPPVATVEYVPVDFPGLDDAAAGPNELLTRIIPDWLRRGWGGPPAGVAIIPIDPRGQSMGSVRSLKDAQIRISRGKAILEFTGAGPYPVSPIVLDQLVGTPVQEITIRGRANGSTTLIMQATAETAAGLKIQRGLLRLENLNLVVVNKSGDQPFHTIQLADSDLVAENCSWTAIQSIQGTSTRVLSAIHTSGASVGHNRLLLTNSSVQGMTALSSDAPEWDVLCGNCWFENSVGPCLALHVPQPVDRQLSQPVRRMSLLGCQIFGGSDLLWAEQGNSSDTPVEVMLRRGVLAGHGSEACAVRLINWDENDAASLEAPLAKNFSLAYEHIRFINCPTLTAFSKSGGETNSVTDVSGWRQFWKQPLSPEAVRTEPALQVSQPAEIVTVWESALGPVKDGQPFYGVAPELLTQLPAELQERIHAAARRPGLPEEFGQPAENATVVRFDLARARQLNDFLNGPQCPDGATVVCFGAGLKMLPAIVLKNKSLRLEFEQTAEGASLDVQPLADLNADVWFDVQGGQLDLINAPFTLPSSGKKKYPQTVLRLQGASGLVQRSRFTAEGEASSVLLIEVIGSPAGSQSLLIADTVLKATGPLLRVPPLGLQAELHNSLLVTSGPALQIQGAAGGTATQGLLYHCTCVAQRGVEMLDRPSAGAVEIFAKEAVFLPTPGSSNPSTLWCAVDHTAGLGLEWWESGCGYAPQYSRWISFGAGDAGSFEEDRERFSFAHYVDPVLGDGGILLASPLPDFPAITPESVTLLPACHGGNWAEQEGPIGIRLPIGPVLTPPPAQPATPKNPTSPTGKPMRTRPDF